METAMTQIIGNIKLKSRIVSDVLSGNFTHACIIEGNRGSGRHLLAKNTAAALSCTGHTEGTPLPCLSCRNCRMIFEGKCPDITVVGTEGKSTLGVDAARFITGDARSYPNMLPHRIYIIEDADRMTAQAQNAFLLTLEDPPSFVKFFLLAENAASLLETVRSRAPVFRTEKLDDSAVAEYLRRNAADKFGALDECEKKELLLLSDGAIGAALRLLDGKRLVEKIEIKNFTAAFIESVIAKKDAAETLLMLPLFSSKRDILTEQIYFMLIALRDIIFLKKDEYAKLDFYIDRESALEICDRTTLKILFDFTDSLLMALDGISRNANVRLTLTKILTDAKIV